MNSERDDILQHYGVLGMKWGVRKDKRIGRNKSNVEFKNGEKWVVYGDDKPKAPKNKTTDDSKRDKKNAKLDKKWEQKLNNTYIQTYNKAASESHKIAKKVNSMPEFKDFDKVAKNPKLKAKYENTIREALEKEIQKQAKTVSGNVSPSGDYELEYSYPSLESGLPTVSIKKIKHSVSLGDALKYSYKGIGNDMYKREDILQHYGVLGMKWGVRKHQPYPKGSKSKGEFVGKVKKKIDKGYIGQQVRSFKTTNKNLKNIRNVDNMSTNKIKQLNKRLMLENELKKGPNKKDYRNRGQMSDEEIKRKVDRVRARAALLQNGNIATKTHVETGKKVANLMVDIAIGSTIKK